MWTNGKSLGLGPRHHAGSSPVIPTEQETQGSNLIYKINYMLSYEKMREL